MTHITFARFDRFVVHVTFTLLLCQRVHANRGSHHWSNWSQHKSDGISKFGTGAGAVAWTSIQWLLTCTTTANYEWSIYNDLWLCLAKCTLLQFRLMKDRCVMAAFKDCRILRKLESCLMAHIDPKSNFSDNNFDTITKCNFHRCQYRTAQFFLIP